MARGYRIDNLPTVRATAQKATGTLGTEGGNDGLLFTAATAGTPGNLITVRIVETDPNASTSPSASPSASASPSLSVSPSASASVSPSASASVSPSLSKSPSLSASPSASKSPSVSPSASPSLSTSPSLSPADTWPTIAVVGNAITATLIAQGHTQVSTANDVKNAINADGPASALVVVTAIGASTGAAIPDAGLVQLAGGRDVLNLAEVAKMAGFSDAYLARLEHGASCEPHEAQRLADALSVSLATLGAVALQ